VNLDEPILQADFAELVGVSEAAVSTWVSDGVIAKGQTARQWLLAYIKRLRDQAAGRDADSPLAIQRARLASEQADRVEMANAVMRKQLAPASLLEEVLANVARQMATKLDALVPQLRTRCPDLDGPPLRLVEEELAALRGLLASVSINDVDATQIDADDLVDAPVDE
jgi:phage terminase Nu1 subunit (DNA packaging protein)